MSTHVCQYFFALLTTPAGLIIRHLAQVIRETVIAKYQPLYSVVQIRIFY